MSDAAPSCSGGSILEPVPDIVKVPCVLCSSMIDATALICTTCDVYQIGKTCRVCGKWIPGRAARCSECDAFQDFRRHIPGNALVLSLLISLISVISTLGPGVLAVINSRSKTTGFVIGGEVNRVISSKQMLILRVLNSGGRSSVVTDADLDLTTLKAGTIPLEFVNSLDRQAPANGKTDLRFLANDSDFKIAEQARQSVIDQLCTAKVAVNLHVDERNLFGTPYNAIRQIPVAGKMVRKFVAARLMSDDQEDCK